jgi:hypothetical protein
MTFVVTARRLNLIQNDIASTILRSFHLPSPSPTHLRIRHQHTATADSRLPRVLQPSIWDSIIPRSLRNRSKPSTPAEKKPPNPATYFIWIYILIGSQAIRILGTKNEHRNYVSAAKNRIARLREVIERLHRGEEVDVEKELGSGVQSEEEEWERALREIVEEDRRWGERKKEDEERLVREAEGRIQASPVNAEAIPADGSVNGVEKGMEAAKGNDGAAEKVKRAPGFY